MTLCTQIEGAIGDTRLQCNDELELKDALHSLFAAAGLVLDGGSDPAMAEVLGLKSAQVKGLLAGKNEKDVPLAQADTDRIKRMASAYLHTKRNDHEIQTEAEKGAVVPSEARRESTEKGHPPNPDGEQKACVAQPDLFPGSSNVEDGKVVRVQFA